MIKMKKSLLTITLITLVANITNAFAEEPKINSQIAVTYSNYAYEEPGVMEQEGNMYGLDTSLNLQMSEENPMFVNFQLALSAGQVERYPFFNQTLLSKIPLNLSVKIGLSVA